MLNNKRNDLLMVIMHGQGCMLRKRCAHINTQFQSWRYEDLFFTPRAMHDEIASSFVFWKWNPQNVWILLFWLCAHL